MTEPEAKDAAAGAEAWRKLTAKLEKTAKGAALSAFDHVAFAALAGSGAGAKATFEALARLREAFVDWNDLRFARIADLAVLLAGFPEPEATARQLRAGYRHQFDESGRMDLSFPDDARLVDVRKRLAKLFPSLGKTAIALILYEHVPGQPLPLSDGALAAAKKHDLLGRQGQRAHLQQKLEDGLRPEEIVRLVQALELEAHGHPYGEPWPDKPAPAPAKKSKPKKRKAE